MSASNFTENIWEIVDVSSSEESNPQGPEEQDFEMVRKNRRKNKFKNKDCDSDYEVIPKPEIRCLDENELEVKENHFVFGIDRNCNSPVDSDSDIEVLSKASSANKGNWLYSQVLQKNLNEQGKSPEHSSCSEGCHELCHALDESDLDFSENHFPNLKDSVDIVFSERVKEQTSSEIVAGCMNLEQLRTLSESSLTKFDNHVHHERTSSLGEDLGIKWLFENSANEFVFEDRYDGDDVTTVSLRTSTLVLFFSITVIVSMFIGNGCGSLFVSRVENRESNDVSESLAHETTTNNEPVKVLILQNGKMEEHVFTSSFLSSKLGNRDAAVNDLIENLQAIKNENRQLALKYEELKESYQLQKQMAWYWKRKAQTEEDNRQIFDAEESKKLEKEHAEKKVSHKKEDSHASIISQHSPADEVVSNVAFPSDDTPTSTDVNVKRFRKIFKIGNIVNNVRPASDKKGSHSDYFCGDDTHEMFKNRWKRKLVNDIPKAQKAEKATKRTNKDNVNKTGNTEKNKCTSTRPNQYQKIHNCKHADILETIEEGFPIERSVFKVQSPKNESIIMASAYPDQSDSCDICLYSNVDSTVVEIIQKKVRVISTYDQKEIWNDSSVDPFTNARKQIYKALNETLFRRNNITTQFKTETKYREEASKSKSNPKKCYKKHYDKCRILHLCHDKKILEIRDENFTRKYSGNNRDCKVCNVKGLTIDIVKGKIRVLQPYRGEKLNDTVDPLTLVWQSLRFRQNVPEINQDQQLNWFRKKASKIGFEFDLYRWKMTSLMKTRISEMQSQISKLSRKNKVDNTLFEEKKQRLKSKVRSLKEHLKTEKKKVRELELSNQREFEVKKNEFEIWKSKEEKKLKLKLKKINEISSDQKRKMKNKIEKAKRILESNLKQEYENLIELKSKKHEILRKKKQSQIHNYEKKYNELWQTVTTLRKLYSQTKNKLKHYMTLVRPDTFDDGSDRKVIRLKEAPTSTKKLSTAEQKCGGKLPLKQVRPVYGPRSFSLKPIPPNGFKDHMNGFKDHMDGFKDHMEPPIVTDFMTPSMSAVKRETKSKSISENETADAGSEPTSSWYSNYGRGRREYNQQVEKKTQIHREKKENWYQEWMRGRERYRKVIEDIYSDKSNWFITLMKEREQRRYEEHMRNIESEKTAEEATSDYWYMKPSPQKNFKDYDDDDGDDEDNNIHYENEDRINEYIEKLKKMQRMYWKDYFSKRSEKDEHAYVVWN